VTATAAGPLLVAGIGELVATADRGATLVAYGLGSCIGLAAWDPRTHAAALAHFMLPAGAPGGLPAKFVEGGFEAFLERFAAVGGSLRRAELKAAGGASMLRVMAGSLDIGRRNAEAVAARLATHGLLLTASDLGGSAGRTVQLSVADGRFHVKSVTRSSVL
jgi:chemotaxis protein CheD